MSCNCSFRAIGHVKNQDHEKADNDHIDAMAANVNSSHSANSCKSAADSGNSKFPNLL
jgi:hypothetical protein